MSDKQPPLWNIRSSDDDDYPRTGRSGAGSSQPFYHNDDDDKLEEQMKRIARQVAVEEIGRKPEVIVVISRLLAE